MYPVAKGRFCLAGGCGSWEAKLMTYASLGTYDL